MSVIAAPASAEGSATRSPTIVQPFDIPAQPVSSAIEAFAVASGVQVIYDRPRGAQPRSNPIQGTFTPRAALNSLLEGTGLNARFTDDQDAVLTPTPLASASASQDLDGLGSTLPKLFMAPLRVEGSVVLDAGRPDDTSARLYATAVQAQLQQVLSSDPRTARGDYDARLELWIGPAGDIRQAGIAQTSGQAQRDADILMVVRRLVMDDPPPKDMVQPIRVAVHSRPGKR